MAGPPTRDGGVECVGDANQGGVLTHACGKGANNSVDTAAKSLGNSGKYCCSDRELQVFHLPTRPCSLYLLSTESSLSVTESGVGCSETYSSRADSCRRAFFPPFHPRARYGDADVHLISRAWDGAVM